MNINNVIGHKKENIRKLEKMYDLTVKTKQDGHIKPGKFEINILKTYKDFLNE